MEGSQLDEVRAALGGVPELRNLVPPAFLERFHLALPAQYGIVCRDVASRIAQLEALGTTPFLHVITPGPGWRERGEAHLVWLEVALGYCAGQQIELLGPGKGTGFYAERIPPDGGFALHHVGIFQHDLGPSRRAFAEAGIDVAVELGLSLGPLYSVDVAYFDTRSELGCYVELLEFRALGRSKPPTEALVSALARLQRPLRGLFRR
ncbi:MAG: VOC family protein [Myxococcota bacterium]|nr:VOC family protein [Myxococcota bacterium]